MLAQNVQDTWAMHIITRLPDMLVNATGGRWLTSSDLIERLVSPSEDLTQTDLSTGAALVTDRLGSVEGDLGARWNCELLTALSYCNEARWEF